MSNINNLVSWWGTELSTGLRRFSLGVPHRWSEKMPNRIAAAIAAPLYVVIGTWLALAAIGIVNPPTGLWPLGVGAIASIVAASRAIGVAIGSVQ